MTETARFSAYLTQHRQTGSVVAGMLVAVLLLTYPLYGTDYQVTQIAALSAVLGTIALSMVFLAGFGGLVSLAQLAIAGLAAYTIGIMTVNHAYPLWQAIPVALLVATVAAFVFAVASVRTVGIYFLMITLALAMIVFNIALENYTVFNGHGGIGGEQAPKIGGLSFDPIAHPRPFYYLVIAVAAVLYVGLRYIIRSPFGLALQGIRDNPRRMRALGYWVEGHRVAAFTLAGFISGVGGILYVWYYSQISPSFIDLTHTVNILIIAVIGGMIYFEGAFIGALAFTIVDNFASSYTDRYNSVIGLTFLLIVMYSPNGLIGLPQLIARLARAATHRQKVPISSPRYGAHTLPAENVITPAAILTHDSGAQQSSIPDEEDRGFRS